MIFAISAQVRVIYLLECICYIDRVSLQIRYSACFRPLSSLLLLLLSRLYDGAAVSNMYNCVCAAVSLFQMEWE